METGVGVRAHRTVLAAATPYFHAMFTSGLMESDFQVSGRAATMTLLQYQLELQRSSVKFKFLRSCRRKGRAYSFRKP